MSVNSLQGRCTADTTQRRFLKAESVYAVQMSDGKLFHAVGPAMLNTCLPIKLSWILLL